MIATLLAWAVAIAATFFSQTGSDCRAQPDGRPHCTQAPADDGRSHP